MASIARYGVHVVLHPESGEISACRTKLYQAEELHGALPVRFPDGHIVSSEYGMNRLLILYVTFPIMRPMHPRGKA